MPNTESGSTVISFGFDFDDIKPNEKSWIYEIDWDAWVSASLKILGQGQGAQGDPLKYVDCLWSGEHSSQSDTATMMIFPNGGLPIYHCMHQHCAHRTLKDLIEFVGIASFEPFSKNKIKPPISPEIAAEIKQKEEENQKILATPFVIPIGYYNTTLSFYCADSKQFLETTFQDLQPVILCSDWKYWEAYCPEAFEYNEKGIQIGKDIKTIKEKLLLDCKKTGRRLEYIDRTECGIYRDKDRIIFNAGGRIFVDGNETEYYKIKSDTLYQASHPVHINTNAATKEDFLKLIELFKRTTLKGIQTPWILLSFLMSAIVSGTSPWRVHAWLNGPSGSGKTELMKIIKILMSGIGCIQRAGSLTEPAIRQTIQKCSTLFIHDEAENSDHIDKEIEFIRVCSSGDEIMKGTISGRPLKFKAKCSFLLSSISSSIFKNVDLSRFLLFETEQNHGTVYGWSELKSEMDSFITEDLSARFTWRMYTKANLFLKTFKKIKEIYMYYLGKKHGIENNNLQRSADLFTTILSTYFVMASDSEKIIDDDVIKKIEELLSENWIKSIFTEEEDSTQLPQDLFNFILDYQLTIKGYTVSIRQILDQDTAVLPGDGAQRECLRSFGIYTMPSAIKFKNKSSFLIKVATAFGYPDYSKILKNYPGATIPKEPRKFSRNDRFRGVEIPYTFVNTIEPVDFNASDYATNYY